MNIGAALSSGANTFMKLQDHQQKQELRDLKKESYNLRNEGYRLDNSLARDTFDSKVAYREGQGRKSQADADKAETAAFVEKATAPYDIGKAKHDARYAQQRHLTESQRTAKVGAQATSAASQARQDLALEDSNIRAGLEENKTTVFSEQQERFDGVRDNIFRVIESADGDLSTLNDNPKTMGSFIGLVRNATGLNVQDAEYDSEGQGFRMAVEGEDGETNQAFVPADEAMQYLADSESMEDLQAQVAQNREAQSIAAEEANRRVSAERQRTEDAAATQRDAVEQRETARKARAALGALDFNEAMQQDRLEKQRAAETAKGPRSAFDRADPSVDTESEKTSGHVKATRQSASNLREGFARPLSGSDEDWEQTIDEAGRLAGSERERTSASLGALGRTVEGARNHSRRDEEASLPQSLSNALGADRDSRFQSPVENAETSADLAEARDAVTKSARETFDRGIERLQKNVDATDKDSRQFSQEALTEAASSTWAALSRNDRAQELMAGTPEQRAKMESLVSLAAGTAVETGNDGGVYLDGFLADNSPAAIDTAAEFAQEPALEKLSFEQQSRAVDELVNRIEEEGMDATVAYRQVLQEVNEATR